ncbi:uncharacterized protein C1orf131 homolog [Cephus cinctus]|uniref:Uncharacterized protein C1orf131 homolog n=1 Tax=Cephus cinctus TaxID=211228 RepID=A0AAJ7BXL9_CEPCN|nr:uncharacterized protein C1orf131 homolog [Cephus cinctus]
MDDFIPTRGAQLKKNASMNFVSVTYKAPKKKSKPAEIPVEGINSDRSPKDTVGNSKEDRIAEARKKQEIEMKRARYDVIKFGMSGFEKAKAHKAKIALAIELGAKPPRKRKRNYKELKVERQKLKEEEKTKEPASGLSRSLKKHRVPRTRKKDNDILGVYGKVQKKDMSSKRK